MVVDDDPQVLGAISQRLQREGYVVRCFRDGRECIAEFKQSQAEIVITDLRMPGMDGMAVLREIKQMAPSTEVLIITGNADKEAAINALHLGAFDLFEKPVSLKEISERLKRTVRYQQVVRDRQRLADQMSFMSRREAERWGVGNFIGHSEATAKILEEIRALQKTDRTTVLITGESGTGKELVARAIHFGGTRAAFPFVPVNCSAIPGDLAESLLFGHLRGSFTGAIADRKGHFEVAHGGTLFLDEIGDMPPNIQTKLLRVLEDGTILPIGSVSNRIVDARIIAATNADIEARVRAGTFREDLYYRLAGYTIAISPLRQRKEDIPPLISHFVRLLSEEMAISVPETGEEFMKALKAYDFPGNVRELKNVIERALIDASGSCLDAAHLHLAGIFRTPAVSGGTVWGKAEEDALPMNLKEAEMTLAKRAVARAKGNVAEAARMMGISRARTYRLLKNA